MHTIKSGAEIKSILVTGRKYVSGSVILYIIKSDGKRGEAAAFIAGKKSFPKAVDRNKARRLLRAVMQKQGLPKNTRALLMARKNILNTSFEDINNDYKSLCDKHAQNAF